MINESPRVTASSVEAEFEITGPVEGVRCFLRSQMDQLWRDCKPVWSTYQTPFKIFHFQ